MMVFVILRKGEALELTTIYHPFTDLPSVECLSIYLFSVNNLCLISNWRQAFEKDCYLYYIFQAF